VRIKKMMILLANRFQALCRLFNDFHKT